VHFNFAVPTVAWVADAYAVVDTTNADTVLVFAAAEDDNGDAVLRSSRHGSHIVGALVAGDSVYFAPPQPAVHMTAMSAGTACSMRIATNNPLITRLLPVACVEITVSASDTLITDTAPPGYLDGVWVTRYALPAVALLR
jgi:hypothetical protein